jgi:hypothetical protein
VRVRLDLFTFVPLQILDILPVELLLVLLILVTLFIVFFLQGLLEQSTGILI